jgi:hypothetical protein
MRRIVRVKELDALPTENLKENIHLASMPRGYNRRTKALTGYITQKDLDRIEAVKKRTGPIRYRSYSKLTKQTLA